MRVRSVQLLSAFSGFILIPSLLGFTGNTLLIIAPTMFWFVTMPLVAMLFFAVSAIEAPRLKLALTNLSIAMSTFLLASACLLMTLVMR